MNTVFFYDIDGTITTRYFDSTTSLNDLYQIAIKKYNHKGQRLMVYATYCNSNIKNNFTKLSELKFNCIDIRINGRLLSCKKCIKN